MEGQGFIGQYIEKLKGAKLRLNRRLLVFIVFFGIATFLWFLKAMDKSYVTHIEHPVIYQNLPEKMVLVKEMPKKLLLEVQGTGYSILRHNWDISKSPVRINFKKLAKPVSMGNTTKISIPTTQVKELITNQLNNLVVLSSQPDSLVFLFSKNYSKKVPVIANIELELAHQFMIRDRILLIPDSVLVSGPAILIDTLKGIQTIPQKFKKVDRSLRRNVGLLSPHNQLEISEKRIIMEVPVEQYTEKSLLVPVSVLNIPDSLILKSFPSEVEVTFRVVVSAFEQIQPEDFTLTIDYENIKVTAGQKAKPLLVAHSGLVENPKLKPEWVNFLLEKK
jgi:hypothetical protein